MKQLIPREIVKELDKYIIGQDNAKRAVAVALRNRWRRKQVSNTLKDEILPHNILMVGPTGVGKTEIARRLAKLSDSPFIKVEATKFTEVGYVGRDVDSIIRDLIEVAIQIVRKSHHIEIQDKAKTEAKIKLIEYLVGKEASDNTKNLYLKKLDNQELDSKQVEISIDILHNNKNTTFPTFDVPGFSGGQMGVINISDILGKTTNTKKQKKLVKVTVLEAMKYLTTQETTRLTDEALIIKKALKITQEDGIVFLDEIDKISGGNINKKNDINREGVQRDLLPLIEGTTVNTKYGCIDTTHILFIASGAFHLAKPSDLLPELQGRLPVRVELLALSSNDLLQILKETKNSLPKQYSALLETEGVTLNFTNKGLESIAKYAAHINNEVENIGARRLYSLLEKILEDISFTADEIENKIVNVTPKFVEEHLAGIALYSDTKKFIL